MPPRGTITDIHYQQSLTIAQKEQIESCKSNQGRIIISLTACFESKVGRIEVKKTIERNSVYANKYYLIKNRKNVHGSSSLQARDLTSKNYFD